MEKTAHVPLLLPYDDGSELSNVINRLIESLSRRNWQVPEVACEFALTGDGAAYFAKTIVARVTLAPIRIECAWDPDTGEVKPTLIATDKTAISFGNLTWLFKYWSKGNELDWTNTNFDPYKYWPPEDFRYVVYAKYLTAGSPEDALFAIADRSRREWYTSLYYPGVVMWDSEKQCLTAHINRLIEYVLRNKEQELQPFIPSRLHVPDRMPIFYVGLSNADYARLTGEAIDADSAKPRYGLLPQTNAIPQLICQSGKDPFPWQYGACIWALSFRERPAPFETWPNHLIIPDEIMVEQYAYGSRVARLNLTHATDIWVVDVHPGLSDHLNMHYLGVEANSPVVLYHLLQLEALTLRPLEGCDMTLLRRPALIICRPLAPEEIIIEPPITIK